MKVHLLRSQELSIQTFGNVLNLLQQFPGPVAFVSAEPEEHLDQLQTRIWEKEEDFLEQQVMEKSFSDSKVGLFPMEEKFQSWEFFFDQCELFRKEQNIPKDDHVFLLTDIGNESNWFGSIGPSMKDYFIQTSHWNMFFGADVDERFPIAYEVGVWLIRHQMFALREEILAAVHKEPRGCANDFCEHKKDIILKMRTADLCSDCMDILHARDVSPLIVGQLFGILDGIRSNLTFRERSKIIRKPSRMEIRGYMNRIFLTDLGNLEVRLNPKERTVYLFYLNHPEGVHLTELQEHREEIHGYYSRITNQYEQEEIDDAMDRLLDPLDNNINEVLSRIKRKLKDLVGDDLLDYYLIAGAHGAEKRISLDREYVTYTE